MYSTNSVFFLLWYTYCKYTNALGFQVKVDDFIQFVIIFTFFNKSEFLPLFYSIEGIYSHIYVNVDQLYNLMRNMNALEMITPVFNNFVNKELNSSIDGKCISMNNISDFLIKYSETKLKDCPNRKTDIFEYIFKVRSAILNKVITQRQYSLILKRINYYKQVIRSDRDKEMYIALPSECLCVKYYRICILNKPHPFDSDYKHINYKRSILLADIKKRYSPHLRASRFSSNRPISKHSQNIGVSFINVSSKSTNFSTNFIPSLELSHSNNGTKPYTNSNSPSKNSSILVNQIIVKHI